MSDNPFLDDLLADMAKAVENPGVASASTGYPIPCGGALRCRWWLLRYRLAVWWWRRRGRKLEWLDP